MLQPDFMRQAFAVSFFIAVLCPCVGIFLVLRRYSMIGDTLSHASLAGVSVALTLGGVPIIGAFTVTAGCGALIEFMRERIKNAELVLTVVLALSVGVAVTLMSRGTMTRSAESFLFGSVLTITRADMFMTLGLCAAAILSLILFYDRLVFISYDEEAARIAGVRVRAYNYLFMILVAAAVSVSIRVVGVLVLSSMIALPVAAALQLGRGFRTTLLASVAFSLFDILGGLTASYYLDVAPGGFTAIVSVAVLFAVIAVKAVMKHARTRKISSVH
ncbi:MAG: metal ABC transporter permease [Oscillospiraceae bacterium]|jgi:zinc transport system permease protein|nr:metal ABC transporter permease [Oscillospiraceae bacterium]